MREREVKLLDLIIEILLYWRYLFLAMCVGALALGSISYISSYLQAQERKELIKLEQEAEERGDIFKKEDPKVLRARLTDKQLANIEYVTLYQQMYDDKVEYANTSILMKMDSTDVKRSELVFLVSSADLEKTYNIERVYEDVVRGAGLVKWLAEKTGISETSISEIVVLERGTGSAMLGADSFRMSVIHYDMARCEEISSQIVEYIYSKQEEFVTTLGEHNVILVDQSFATVTDTEVLTRQRSYLSDMATIQTAIADAKAKFTEDEIAYYELITEGKTNNKDVIAEENEKAEGEDTLPEFKVGVSVKHILLGLILGFLVYVFVVVVRYLTNDTLRVGDNLYEIYNIAQLGCVTSDIKKGGLFHKTEQKILAIAKRGERQFTYEDSLRLAETAVKMAALKSRVNQVCIVGCNMQKDTENICRDLLQILDKENIKGVILNNIIYDAEAMSKLAGAEGVILVEKVHSTMYKEIERELEVIKRQEIQVLGGIIVE